MVIWIIIRFNLNIFCYCYWISYFQVYQIELNNWCKATSFKRFWGPGVSFIIVSYAQNGAWKWHTWLSTSRLRSIKNKLDGRMCAPLSKLLLCMVWRKRGIVDTDGVVVNWSQTEEGSFTCRLHSCDSLHWPSVVKKRVCTGQDAKLIHLRTLVGTLIYKGKFAYKCVCAWFYKSEYFLALTKLGIWILRTVL